MQHMMLFTVCGFRVYMLSDALLSERVTRNNSPEIPGIDE